MEAALDYLSIALIGLGVFLLRQLKVATEVAVQTTAEETARETVARIVWPQELARELQKTRGTERQELRFRSYAGLWKELRPLAIYDGREVSRRDAAKLSESLSNWYFSENGGLLLTPQTRSFYFALQDLLRRTSGSSEAWIAVRSDAREADQKQVLRGVLPPGSAVSPVLEYFEAEQFLDWNDRAVELGRGWRSGINSLGERWGQLNERERFAVLQQTGSILRTSLTNDLESRLQ